MNQTDMDVKIALERVRQLEENLYEMNAEFTNLAKAINEMQKVIVRVATSQQQVVDRVKSWPYVNLNKSIDPDE